MLPSGLIRKIFPGVLWKIKTEKKEVWLTFDDGPNIEATPWILSVLSELNIKATFFLIGNDIKKNPELFRQILKNGHRIGNHSYSHKNGWKESVKEYVKDVKKCEELLDSNLIFRQQNINFLR